MSEQDSTTLNTETTKTKQTTTESNLPTPELTDKNLHLLKRTSQDNIKNLEEDEESALSNLDFNNQEDTELNNLNLSEYCISSDADTEKMGSDILQETDELRPKLIQLVMKNDEIVNDEQQSEAIENATTLPIESNNDITVSSERKHDIDEVDDTVESSKRVKLDDENLAPPIINTNSEPNNKVEEVEEEVAADEDDDNEVGDEEDEADDEEDENEDETKFALPEVQNDKEIPPYSDEGTLVRSTADTIPDQYDTSVKTETAPLVEEPKLEKNVTEEEGNEAEEEEEDEDEEERIEEDEQSTAIIDMEKQRLDALKEITDIEHKFAELRQKLYENKMVRLETELQMCLEGSHPELQGYYQAIASIRDYKLRRAYQKQKYELQCIDKETHATRTFIHQDFYRKVNDERNKLLTETTQTWYDINKERRELDISVPNHGYHVPIKLACGSNFKLYNRVCWTCSIET